MIKVYFDDGSKKKVDDDTFIQWLNECNLEVDETDIYYNGSHIAKYICLLDNNFGVLGVLDCILCLVLLTLIILVLMKGGVIL